MRSTVKRVTTRESFYVYADLMDRRLDFKTGGALRGEATPEGYYGSFGEMPYAFRVQLNSHGHYTNDEYETLNADLRDFVDYVVYSYQTPIALHITRGADSFWVCPETHYSQTTSCHQGRINTAASVSDSPRILRTATDIHRYVYGCEHVA